VRAKSLQTELVAKKVEKTLLTRTTESRIKELSRGHSRMRELRGGDVAGPHREVGAMSRSGTFKFRLYLAGDTHDSMLALANLSALCEARLPNDHKIELVDVLRQPQRALADGILMTPTLFKLAPSPVQKIVGTLQSDRVWEVLGLGTLGTRVPLHSTDTLRPDSISSRSEGKRIRFIEHKGKQILLSDFSLATAQLMIPLLAKLRTTVAQYGPESALILADYQGAEIDHRVAIKIKEVLAHNRPFVKKAVWLGTEQIPHDLIENIHMFSQRETVTFTTREEALEWLVRE
jgi:circadian clock protein KaiB